MSSLEKQIATPVMSLRVRNVANEGLKFGLGLQEIQCAIPGFVLRPAIAEIDGFW
jgi:hypothetical protein